MQWLKWSVIAFAGLVALGIFALVGPLLAITVPFFLWKDWFGARSSLNAQVPSLSTVPPGMLAVISFVAVGGAWYGLTGGFRAPANSTGTMAALSSDSPSNPASTSPAALAALAPAAIPTPQSTAIPGPASTPAPTPTSLPPAMQLEVLWGQSDWTSIVALLTPMRGGPGWTQELNNKLYAAYINRGKGYLKSNVTNAAIEDFNRAVEVNPGAGQAQLEIQTVKNQEAEAAKVRARAGSDLEIVSMSCRWDNFGFAYVLGEVRNISGKSLRNVTAVGNWYTKDGQLITSDLALITFNPILPNQTSSFKTFSTYNPAMDNCKLQFKDLLGGSIPSYYER